MLSPAVRHADPPPVGHPCFGCEVRTASICGVLGCGDLAEFKRLGWTMRVKAGQAVFHQGDPATRVFTLTSGAMKLYRLLPDGRRQVVGFLLPGDFLGITVDDEYAFTVEALEDSRLCWFPRSRFADFTEMHPDLELAAHELAAAQQQMVLLGRKTAEERVASFFLALLDRGEQRGPGARRLVDLPMSRCDIADYLGLTKETVSRVLGLLKSKRLVRQVGVVFQTQSLDKALTVQENLRAQGHLHGLSGATLRDRIGKKAKIKEKRSVR